MQHTYKYSIRNRVIGYAVQGSTSTERHVNSLRVVVAVVVVIAVVAVVVAVFAIVVAVVVAAVAVDRQPTTNQEGILVDLGTWQLLLFAVDHFLLD